MVKIILKFHKHKNIFINYYKICLKIYQYNNKVNTPQKKLKKYNTKSIKKFIQ